MSDKGDRYSPSLPLDTRGQAKWNKQKESRITNQDNKIAWFYPCTPTCIHRRVCTAQAMSCVLCVFFPSILDIKFVGRTSRGHTGGRSHRIFNPPSFCGACLDFCREKDSAIPFPRRPWCRILCTNELIVLHPLGIFIFGFLVFSEKNPVCRDRTHVPTCQKVTRCRLSYRGRPAYCV